MLRSIIVAGTVLGIGFGGFFDGIVLHQLLQWHHLVSNIYPPTDLEALELNTLWDGIFHSAMYIVVAVGLVLLWRALRQTDHPDALRVLVGAILLGAGIFHIFDSIVNHWVLGIHHIRPGPNEVLYDLAFFAIGLVLFGVGLISIRNRLQSA
jgi:uncharacterized membrane protein